MSFISVIYKTLLLTFITMNLTLAAAEPQTHSHVLRHIDEIDDLYRRNDFCSLIDMVGEGDNDVVLDIIEEFSDEPCGIMLIFYQKKDLGYVNFCVLTLLYNDNKSLAGFHESNYKRNYSINAEYTDKGSLELLEIKATKKGEYKWAMSSEERVSTEGNPEIPSMIRFSSPRNPHNNVVLAEIDLPESSSIVLDPLIKKFDSVRIAISSRKREDVKNALSLKNECSMIYKMSYNSSGCVEMLAIADSPMPQKSFVLRLSGKCITEYYEGDVDFNDNIRMKDGVGYMTKKRIPLNGNGIVIKFFSDGTPSTYKTIVRNRLFGRQIEWDEKGNVISDVDLDIPKPWSGAPKSQEGQQQLAKDQPVAKEAKLASPMRVWTTADGKSKTTARIIAKTDETVTLENEAGKRMEVKIERLIESDQKYITTWQQPEK